MPEICGLAPVLRLYPDANVPCYMGNRVQEIARLRTIEFLIEQAVVLGTGHQTITVQLNALLATIRNGLSDVPADSDDVV